MPRRVVRDHANAAQETETIRAHEELVAGVAADGSSATGEADTVAARIEWNSSRSHAKPARPTAHLAVRHGPPVASIGFVNPSPKTTEPVPTSGIAVRESRAVGQIIDGQYEVLGKLGEGGMAVVYEARELPLGRRVALKVCIPGAHESLQREAQALSAIRHPGFATVYHLGRHGEAHYLAMERIFGETLASRLHDLALRQAPMPLDDVLHVLIGVTDALSAAHSVGIAQRDLKPANVILAGERVVLVDFGLFIPEVLVSPENEVNGTPEYVAPEVLTRSVAPGEGPLIDLYALGILAFELLTNRTPFVDDDVRRIISRHVATEPPDVSQLREMPPELAALVSELLAKDPHDRPPSAEAVLWQLKHIRDRRQRSSQSARSLEEHSPAPSARFSAREP